jgi:ParB family chromosome partitioning protein
MPETRHISLAEIDPPELAMRQEMDDIKLTELRESMADLGLIHPLCVVARDGRYVVEDGHRRYVCACDLGWPTIRCEVYTPEEIASGAVMVAANRMREDPSAAEEALLYEKHRALYGLDEAGLCNRFHVTPNYLGERFRLLRCDPQVFDAVLKRRISFAVARELNKCEDETHRRYLLDIAVRTEYSSRVIADMVRQWRKEAAPQAVPGSPSPQVEQPAPPPAYRPECCLCGGYLDPWRLISVMIHEDELKALREQLERTARAE